MAERVLADEHKPTAMALSSVIEAGTLTVPFVLCKEVDDQGVTFFTNLKPVGG